MRVGSGHDFPIAALPILQMSKAFLRLGFEFLLRFMLNELTAEESRVINWVWF